MGYLGFFYIEEKVFEIWTVLGFKGICFSEWSRRTLRAVMMGKTSLIWLMFICGLCSMIAKNHPVS
jgi:hypothetical protein